MKIIFSEKQARFAVSVIAILGAMLLGFTGMIFGNKPIVKPDLRDIRIQVWQDRVKNEDLIQWIIVGKRTFIITGFRTLEDIQKKGRIKTSDCVEKKNLQDIKWLRSRFPNLQIPMIVYGENAQDSLEVATLLRYYGYDAKMLEGGYDKFVQDVLKPVKIPAGVSPEKRKELELKQAYYKYFSNKDPSLGEKKVVEACSILQGAPKKGPTISVEGC